MDGCVTRVFNWLNFIKCRRNSGSADNYRDPAAGRGARVFYGGQLTSARSVGRSLAIWQKRSFTVKRDDCIVGG